MLSFLLVMLIQMQPMQTMPQARSQPNQAVVASDVRRQRMIENGRRLLAQAEAMRQNYQPGPGQPTVAELDASIEQMKSDIDTMSEMGEMESLRLQMAMDRMSKMMSTLSNLLKKISDTSQTITQNMK